VIAFEGALQIVVEQTPRLPARLVRLDKALGRRLAETIRTPFPLPSFDNSAVDGYALRTADYPTAAGGYPVALNMVGTIRAGDAAEEPLVPGTALRIMTGAPVPPGCDAVVMREDIESGAGLYLSRPPLSGENIRPAGGELSAGVVVAVPGTAVTPPLLGLFASLGLTKVRVYDLPSVAIITTGDELLAPGCRPSRGCIFDSAGPALRAASLNRGLTKVHLTHCSDDPTAMKGALEQSFAHADLVLTTGGVSVGDYDFVIEAAREAGVRELFWKVAMKPGKPLYFGTYDPPDGTRSKLLFGLPGNPVSAMVGFELFVATAINAMAGALNPLPRWFTACLTTHLVKKPGRAEFVRGQLGSDDAGLTATPVVGQDSHMLSGLAAADCLIHFPQAAETLSAGTPVDIFPMNWSHN